jgi:hypothetical protein
MKSESDEEIEALEGQILEVSLREESISLLDGEKKIKLEVW